MGTTSAAEAVALYWDRTKVVGALALYSGLSFVVIAFAHASDIPSVGGLVVFLMLIFTGVCMKTHTGGWSVGKKIGFVFGAWVAEAILTVPFGLTIANPTYRLFGPVWENGIRAFLASIPVIFFAMRESRIFVSTQKQGQVIQTGWKNDAKLLAQWVLLFPLVLLSGFAILFNIVRTPFFNYPDPASAHAPLASNSSNHDSPNVGAALNFMSTYESSLCRLKAGSDKWNDAWAKESTMRIAGLEAIISSQEEAAGIISPLRRSQEKDIAEYSQTTWENYKRGVAAYQLMLKDAVLFSQHPELRAELDKKTIDAKSFADRQWELDAEMAKTYAYLLLRTAAPGHQLVITETQRDALRITLENCWGSKSALAQQAKESPMARPALEIHRFLTDKTLLSVGATTSSKGTFKSSER